MPDMFSDGLLMGRPSEKVRGGGLVDAAVFAARGFDTAGKANKGNVDGREAVAVNGHGFSIAIGSAQKYFTLLIAA